MNDLISRRAAIDAVLDRMDAEKYGRDAKRDEIKWTLEKLPSAEQNAIPLEWIEKHFEWLDSFDNDLAMLVKANIQTMVNAWEKEQRERRGRNG